MGSCPPGYCRQILWHITATAWEGGETAVGVRLRH